jgi:hypothetical protein
LPVRRACRKNAAKSIDGRPVAAGPQGAADALEPRVADLFASAAVDIVGRPSP